MRRIEFTRKNSSNVIEIPSGASAIHFEQMQSTHPFQFSSIMLNVEVVGTVVFQMYIDQANRFVMPKAPFVDNWIKINPRKLKAEIAKQNNPWIEALSEDAILYLYYETK